MSESFVIENAKLKYMRPGYIIELDDITYVCIKSDIRKRICNIRAIVQYVKEYMFLPEKFTNYSSVKCISMDDNWELITKYALSHIKTMDDTSYMTILNVE